MTESRTQKMFKSARISLCFYVLDILMHFVSRKVFIDKLGAEVLGLNTMAVNLLNLLNVAELGVGTAVTTILFKPLHEGNRRAVNEIMALQGWFYRYIAGVLVAISGVTMLFFPLIFSKADVPTWYPYATFSVLLVGIVSSYLWAYQQTLLHADQRYYVAVGINHSCRFIKVAAQIAAVYYLAHGYVWWLTMEVIGAGLVVWATGRMMHYYYPWLRPDWRKGGEFRRRYPEVLRKTKQAFVHRLGAVVVAQVTPILIYAVASLTVVAIYGNYALLFAGFFALLNVLFGTLISGFGNLVASGKHDHARKVFWEISAFRYWLAFLFCIVTWKVAPAFIRLWVGADFLLPWMPFALLNLYYFILFSQVSHQLLYSYGALQDVGAPVAEALLTIVGGWLFGSLWGLSGVLVGMIMGQVVITVCWKAWFICRHGLHISVWVYVRKTLGFLLLGGLGVGALHWAQKQMPAFVIDGWKNCLMYAAGWGLCAGVLLTLLFSLGSAEFRSLYRRIPGIKNGLASERNPAA